MIRQRTSNQYAGKNVKGREATHRDHHKIMVRRLRASAHLPRPITAVAMLTVRRSPGVLSRLSSQGERMGELAVQTLS